MKRQVNTDSRPSPRPTPKHSLNESHVYYPRYSFAFISFHLAKNAIVNTRPKIPSTRQHQRNKQYILINERNCNVEKKFFMINGIRMYFILNGNRLGLYPFRLFVIIILAGVFAHQRQQTFVVVYY